MGENLNKLTDVAVTISKKFKFDVNIFIDRKSSNFRFYKKNLATSISFSNDMIDDILDIKVLRNKLLSVAYDLQEMIEMKKEVL